MTSLATMLQRVHGLVGTDDLNPWERDFVESVWERTRQATDTTTLTSAQAGKVEQIFDKHFAG